MLTTTSRTFSASRLGPLGFASYERPSVCLLEIRDEVEHAVFRVTTGVVDILVEILLEYSKGFF